MTNSIKNDLTQKYSRPAIIIHWATAVLIIILFPLGQYMAGIEPSKKIGLIRIHVLLGIIILLLTVMRSWLYFKKEHPEKLKTGSRFNDRLAIWIHNAFYFLLFGIAITGIVSLITGGYGRAIMSEDTGLIIDRNEISTLRGHGALAWILIILLVLHVAGVVKHYLLMKENTLKRIM